MRITRETLLKIAQETALNQARKRRDLLAAYLSGSLLEDEYLLGGTADIDLVMVYQDEAPFGRQILRLTDDVHLDISHEPQSEYQQARQLRTHHWLGPALNSCKVIYDPHHFLDFTQASVRGQFDRPDHVLERCRRQLDQARQIWFSYQAEQADPGPEDIYGYLRAVGHAANAIASLSGAPLTERRFLMKFPQRAAAVNRPGLYAGLLGLLGAPNLVANDLSQALADWDAACQSLAGTEIPARLHPDRRRYYYRAFEAQISGTHPEVVLWPLLRTWTLAVGFLPAASDHYLTWSRTLTRLGLFGEAFSERLLALDAFLDVIDETLERWGRDHGA